MESEQREKWIKKAFWFLVEQYNFKYDGYMEGHSDFISEKVKVRIEPGHKTPYTFIYRIGEPEFTRLVLEGILQYLEGKAPDFNFQTYSLEYNLEIEANILKERARKIISEIDDWWIPIHKFQYELDREEYKKNGQLEDFLSAYKRHYDYLKSKGAI
jgi:hypothetical protein